MTQKRETWQPPCLWIPGLSLPHSLFMHLVKCMLKRIKKSLRICQDSEAKLFFSRLRVKKQISRAELYVFLTNFFRTLFFPPLDGGVTSIPCAAGVGWQSSRYSRSRISQSSSLRRLTWGTITTMPAAICSHPPPNRSDTFLKEGSGKIFPNKGAHCV